MDPNANLDEQRRLQRTLCALDKPYLTAAEEVTRVQTLELIAELAEELDHWLSRGGFYPKAWKGENR